MRQSKGAVKGREPEFITGARPWLILILIVTCFIYSGIFNHTILNFDDIEYFTAYPEIRELSWNSVSLYFSRHYVLMYQPLPVLSFAINYALTELNTTYLHLLNLLLHLVNIILVYHFTFKLTSHKTGSLLIAFVFAVHPLNVESVTWISARSSTMYACFYISALLFYIRFITEGNRKRYFLCLLFFLFSLFSKAQAVTLPVVLLLIDYFFSRKLNRNSLTEKVPFFALSIVFGIIALSDPSTQSNITSGMMISYSGTDKIFLVTYSLLFYLIKSIVPFNLCSIYVYPPRADGHLPLEYYLSAVIIIALLFLVWKMRSNRKVVFAVAFFLFTIAINIQIIPSRLFITADRYAYIPAIGLFLLTVFWFSAAKVRPQRYILVYALLLIYYTAYSFNRTKVWANDLTLMNDIIEKNPSAGYLARAYGIRGLYHASNNNPQAAVSDFTTAVALNPDDAKTYLNRGLVYARSEMNSEAVADFDSAIVREPIRPEIYSYRSIVNYKLKRIENAWSDCNKCIDLDSTFFDCYITRATLAFEGKHYQQSIDDLTRAIYFQPSNAIAHKNRGQVYLHTGKRIEGCADLQNAVNLGNNEAQQLFSSYCSGLN